MVAYGARKYVRAILAGDIASDAVIEERRDICRRCPSQWYGQAAEDTGESLWCGKPEPGGMDRALPTCGCFLAGKTAVASEACPQGKWGAVQPATVSAPRRRRSGG